MDVVDEKHVSKHEHILIYVNKQFTQKGQSTAERHSDFTLY